MKKYLRKLRKTGLRAKILFSNGLFLLLLISCTRKSVNSQTNLQTIALPFPLELKHELSIFLDVSQFLPDKIVCDIKGNIFISGNKRRLFYLEDNLEISEINIEEIYPCEIVDIGTDGFDIFLLDRMNRKLWTVKRESVLENGFPLEERPLFFSVSEKGLFTVIYTNRREFSIFSRTEKRFSGFQIEEAAMEGDRGSLLFMKDNIYFANNKGDRVELFYLYNPGERQHIDVESPTSLALDTWNNLFIASNEGLVCIPKNNTGKILLSNEILDSQIAISKEKIYILNPEGKKIDVYKIVYTSFNSNIPRGE